MTTSGGARKPAGRRAAEADTTRDAVQSPDSAAADSAPGRGPLAGALSAAPDDVQQVEQEIERTREQLGEMDTIVGRPRFLADDDDAVSLVAASFDERFAEVVPDHAVADNDKGLRDAAHLGADAGRLRVRATTALT